MALERVSYMLDMEYKEVDLLCVEDKRSETTDKLPFLQERDRDKHTQMSRSKREETEGLVHWVHFQNTHIYS